MRKKLKKLVGRRLHWRARFKAFGLKNGWPDPMATVAITDVIRVAPSPLSLKESLLDRIDVIEDRVWKGGRLDYSRWRRHDAAIRELLKQGLDQETASLIERELHRIDRQIDEKDGPDEGRKP